MDKRKMRRKNLLYKLRRKGVRCSTKERMIFYPYGGTPLSVVQIRRLCEEYGFNVQFEIM
ncbi:MULTISPECIES: hypothetical protein [Phocaeicola]|jgi:hypothetical protein|nr:hypothetical protein [Phocaeicola massiliensis]